MQIILEYWVSKFFFYTVITTISILERSSLMMLVDKKNVAYVDVR